MPDRSNAKMIDIKRWREPFFLFLNGEGGEVGQRHNGLWNPQTTLHYFLFSLIPSAFLLLLINPLGESTWAEDETKIFKFTTNSDGFTSFCADLILWKQELLSNDFA